MFILSRAVIFSLALCTFPLSISYAQENEAVENPSEVETNIEEDASKEDEKVLSIDEAKNLIFESPTAKDAIGGPVNTNAADEYYDIHARKLAYRENAKEFTNSINERRVDFESPRLKAIQNHAITANKAYIAESAAYNEAEEEKKSSDEAMVEEEDKSEMTVATAEKSTPTEPEETLKEENIPPKEGDDTQRKVITSDDAPDFDPANL